MLSIVVLLGKNNVDISSDVIDIEVKIVISDKQTTILLFMMILFVMNIIIFK